MGREDVVRVSNEVLDRHDLGIGDLLELAVGMLARLVPRFVVVFGDEDGVFKECVPLGALLDICAEKQVGKLLRVHGLN